MSYLRIISPVLVWALFLKLALFWLWLWQLKDYHWGRFRAHFEAQAAKKIISSFWRLKKPVLTPKMLVMIFSMTLTLSVFLLLVYALPLKTSLLLYLGLIILAPVITGIAVLLFQIPTVVIRRRILEKARKKREQFPDLIVVGITGSYGKSSTKEFLATILAERFQVLKTEKNINAEIGIAKTILSRLKPGHQVFVAEIGAYEQGKIKQVCKMLQPQIGVLTGINEQHMSTFGSKEKIIKAKFELIEALPRKGMLVLNGENDIINQESKCKDIKKTKKTTKQGLYSWLGDRGLVSHLPPFDVENLAMVVEVAEALGMTEEEIKRGMGKIKPSLAVEEGREGVKIINSTYSSNPKSVLSHLDYIRELPGKKIIVMPCLIELSKAAERVHREIGERIGNVCDLAIITTADYFKQIKQGALKAGMNPKNILLLEKLKPMLQKIDSFVSSNDIILLEGRLPDQILKHFRS